METIDYVAILAGADRSTTPELVWHLRSTLPRLWLQAYVAASARPTNVLEFRHGDFSYFYDYYAELEATGALPIHLDGESRLVAVCGTSTPKVGGRDDYRLRGWVGRTEQTFGPAWDKGHFIAHSIGGIVDGLEVNIFLQRRDVNRGWGRDGKRYRTMEKYCSEHAGVFCFSRPIYSDGTSCPSEIEFGVLRELNDIWVERFPNCY